MLSFDIKEDAFLLIRKPRDSGNEVAKYKQTQLVFTCSKFKIETLEQGGVILVILLLTLNTFHTWFCRKFQIQFQLANDTQKNV